MTKKCVQCGRKFTLTDSEINFFKSKNLSIPKRCKDCREQNKASRNSGSSRKYRSYYVKRGKPVRLTTVILATMLTLLSILLKADSGWILSASALSTILILNYIADLLQSKVLIQEFDTSPYKYTFYDTNAMVKHYVKHGKQTDCNSMEQYLSNANKVILSKSSLSKHQKKDNDLIYYNNKTNEFVVVAKAGYIRTYFIASDKYYNKQ